jgi:hypothetical protein
VFDLPSCRARKFTLSKDANPEQLRYFQSSIAKLVEDYKIEKIVIKERPQKGKFAGSAIGFKMEAAIQLIESVEVELISNTTIKEVSKRHPVMIDFADTELKKFQEQAFMCAYSWLMAK